jgi:transcriptional regulator with XRE-family HTH domain
MGARLQAIRIEQGHTKAALARLIEVTPGTDSDIENGGQAKVKTIEALADALGVSPAWLAFNQEPQVLPSRRGGRPRSAASSPDPAV